MESLQKRIENKSVFIASLKPSFPKKNLLIEVTNFCNHSCIFCANSKMTRKRGFIKAEIVHKALLEAYSLGTREVGFYATGEPLINKNLEKYIGMAKKIGYSYTYLTTNGALLNNKRMQSLVHSGIDSIKFSINAGSRSSYAKIHGQDDFFLVLKNMKQLSEYRRTKKIDFKIFASYVANRINLSEIEDLKELISGYVDEIAVVNVGNQGGLMYEVNVDLMVDGNDNISQRIPCSMLFNSLTVTHEGYVTACCVDFQNYLVMADLNKVSLADAWNSETYQQLRHCHLSNSLKGTMCYNCIYNKNEKMEPILAEYATIF